MNLKIGLTILLLVTAVANCAAQQLTLAFRGHDGSAANEAVFPVLSTGSLVGAVVGVEGPDIAECVVAYYSSNGCLLNSTTGSSPAERTYFVFRMRDRILKREAGRKYSISIPIGAEGAELPVGNFLLRIWIGARGSMQFDPVTSEPLAGYSATVACQVCVTNVPFAVYVPNPRHLQAGSNVAIRIVTSTPVAQDEFFQVYSPKNLGALSVSQVMIPAGKTCSSEFIMVAESSPGAEGQVVAIAANRSAYRSSKLRIDQETWTVGEGEQPAIPALDEWAYCAYQSEWLRYGENEPICGPCADNPDSHPSCQAGPGEMRGSYTRPKCMDWLWDECEFFLETQEDVQTYTASNTFDQLCSGIKWKVNLQGGVEADINVASGNLGGEVALAGTSVKYRKCCLMRSSEKKTLTRIQCRTID